MGVSPARYRRTMVDTPEPRPRLLARGVSDTPLSHDPVGDVVAGSPTTGTRTFGTLGEVEVGIWEMSPGVVRDTEVDEIFLVLSGVGRVEFGDGEVLDLSPGDVVRLRAGERTVWTVVETLRKIWVA